MTDTSNIPLSGGATAPDGTKYALSGSLSIQSTPPPPPPAPPPPPSGRPIFGFNDKVDPGLPGVAAALGCKPIPGAKAFNNGMPSSWPVFPAGVSWPVLCIKPALPMSAGDRATLASLAKQAAAAQSHPSITLYQEGEHSGLPVATVKAAHAQAWDIVHTAAPSVRYGQCLMSFSARPSGNNALADWTATQTDGQPLDWYGFDTYPWADTVSSGTVLDACLHELESVVPSATVAITELNVTHDITTGATVTDGAAWFAEAWSWAQAHAALLFFVFAQSGRNVPWPPDAATLAELSTIAHAAGL